MSDSVRPHRRQPTRLCHPWDSPGKNTGVGCHFLLQCMQVKSESEVAQSCPTLSDPTDCSLPGSSIHGISQARVPEWAATAFSGPFANHQAAQESRNQECQGWVSASQSRGKKTGCSQLPKEQASQTPQVFSGDPRRDPVGSEVSLRGKQGLGRL